MAHTSSMLTQVALNRSDRTGRYADILDCAEVLALGEYGSATTALAAMVRRSPLFLETLRQLELRRAQGAEEVTLPAEATA